MPEVILLIQKRIMKIINYIEITPEKEYSLEEVSAVAKDKKQVRISPEIIKEVKNNLADFKKLKENSKVYGYNTGVGNLCKNTNTENESIVQKRLILSHSCGLGKFLSNTTVRAIIFCRLITLSKAKSGVRPEIILFMTELLNKDVIPLVPSLGSIGASDLTQLAQIFCTIYNQGKVLCKGKVYRPYEAFSIKNIDPPNQLEGREGLALINGNDGSIGKSCLLTKDLEETIYKSIIISALTCEGKISISIPPRNTDISIKKFSGQVWVTSCLKKLLNNSNLISNATPRKLLQDPLSFRCMPQVFGSLIDSWNRLKSVCNQELNSYTDNPLIKRGNTINNGNFYCLELANALDQVNSNLSQLANSSVARMQVLTNPNFSEGLPEYLIPNSKTNSGFMIPIYSVQAIASEIIALSSPRSVISKGVANGQEDISTNAFNASINTEKVINYAKKILAIELIYAMQAISLRLENKKGKQLGDINSLLFKKILEYYRSKDYYFPIEEDIYMQELIASSEKIINSNLLINEDAIEVFSKQ